MYLQMSVVHIHTDIALSMAILVGKTRIGLVRRMIIQVRTFRCVCECRHNAALIIGGNICIDANKSDLTIYALSYMNANACAGDVLGFEHPMDKRSCC